MATKKKATKTRKRRKIRRFGVGIFTGRAHLAWLGAETEKEMEAIVAKAKKHPLVDRVEVMDRKNRYDRDEALTTYLKSGKRWRVVRSADFLP